MKKTLIITSGCLGFGALALILTLANRDLGSTMPRLGGSKYIAPGVEEHNRRNRVIGLKILAANAEGRFEDELDLWREQLAKDPNGLSVNAQAGLRLAEEGYLAEAGPLLDKALNPPPKSFRISNGDPPLIYWYLKYGRQIQDQRIIDRATELIKTKHANNMFEDNVGYLELKESGLTIDEVSELYAGLSNLGMGEQNELAHSLLKNLGEKYPNNWVLCSLLAFNAHSMEAHWKYLTNTYKFAPPAFKQRLIDDDSDLGWSIMNFRQELGEIPE